MFDGEVKAAGIESSRPLLRIIDPSIDFDSLTRRSSSIVYENRSLVGNALLKPHSCVRQRLQVCALQDNIVGPALGDVTQRQVRVRIRKIDQVRTRVVRNLQPGVHHPLGTRFLLGEPAPGVPALPTQRLSKLFLPRDRPERCGESDGYRQPLQGLASDTGETRPASEGQESVTRPHIQFLFALSSPEQKHPQHGDKVSERYPLNSKKYEYEHSGHR